MANDDTEYTRITLRIPNDLHADLTKLAKTHSRSMNAEIIGVLREGIVQGDADTEMLYGNNKVTFWIENVRPEIKEKILDIINDGFFRMHKIQPAK